MTSPACAARPATHSDRCAARGASVASGNAARPGRRVAGPSSGSATRLASGAINDTCWKCHAVSGAVAAVAAHETRSDAPTIAAAHRHLEAPLRRGGAAPRIRAATDANDSSNEMSAATSGMVSASASAAAARPRMPSGRRSARTTATRVAYMRREREAGTEPPASAPYRTTGGSAASMATLATLHASASRSQRSNAQRRPTTAAAATTARWNPDTEVTCARPVRASARRTSSASSRSSPSRTAWRNPRAGSSAAPSIATPSARRTPASARDAAGRMPGGCRSTIVTARSSQRNAVTKMPRRARARRVSNPPGLRKLRGARSLPTIRTRMPPSNARAGCAIVTARSPHARPRPAADR